MYTSATMLRLYHCENNFNNEIVGDVVLDTMGDRILDLLKSQGRADRGTDYEQQELMEWLTGEKLAPNGERYSFNIDRSHVSRLVRNKIKNPPWDELGAICDIFHTDLEWLVRGKIIPAEEKEESADIFMTPEAGMVALLVDSMEEENRQFILSVATYIGRLDNDARQWDYEIAKILARNIEQLPNGDRARARLLLSQIQPQDRPGRSLPAN